MQVSAEDKIIHICPVEIPAEGASAPDLRMEATSPEEAQEWTDAIQVETTFFKIISCCV